MNTCEDMWITPDNINTYDHLRGIGQHMAWGSTVSPIGQSTRPADKLMTAEYCQLGTNVPQIFTITVDDQVVYCRTLTTMTL